MTSQGWQKRVDRQKESANANLTSWFLKTFSSGKKTQFLRDRDEHSAPKATTALPTRALGQLSAVASAAGGGPLRSDNDRRTPQRQKSFLRQQLMEMKRASAETLLRAQQQRIDGQISEEEQRLAELDSQQRFSDDEDDDEDFDSDDESVHELDEALGDLRLSIDPAASTSSMASTATASTATTVNRSHRSSSAASAGSSGPRRSRKKLSRRSSSARSEEAKDAEMAEAEQRAEYSMEVSRRLSQATQLYAEAIYALDSALNPAEAKQPMPEPRPLMLGTKNSAKSEWI